MLQGEVTLPRNASAVAIRNADQQRFASATDSGSVGGPGGGAAPWSGLYGDPGAVKPWDPLKVPSDVVGVVGGLGTILGGFRGVLDKVGDASWLARVGNGSV